MLFTEEQLRIDVNPFTILDQAVYLTEDESIIQPKMIPIIENKRIGNLVSLHYLEDLCNEHGFGLPQGLAAISEAMDVDVNTIKIALMESDVIMNPDLVNIHENVVIVPESTFSDEYNYVVEAVNHWIETGCDDKVLLQELWTATEVQLALKTPKNFAAALANLGINPKSRKLNDMFDPQKEYKTYTELDDAVDRNISKVAGTTSPTAAFMKLLKLGSVDHDYSDTDNELIEKIMYNKDKIIEANNKKHSMHPTRFAKLLSMVKSLYHVNQGTKYDIPDGGLSIDRIKGKVKGWTQSSTEDKPNSDTKSSTIGSKIGSAISSVIGSSSHTGDSKSSSGGSKIGSAINSVVNNSSSQGMGLVPKLAIGAGIASAIGGGILAYRHYRDKPKSVIAKRIAALRNIYSKFMLRAQKAPNEGIKNKIRRIAAKILGVIDKLLGFLQRKADGR